MQIPCYGNHCLGLTYIPSSQEKYCWFNVKCVTSNDSYSSSSTSYPAVCVSIVRFMLNVTVICDTVPLVHLCVTLVLL